MELGHMTAESEFISCGHLSPSLYENGFLTGLEYRLIICTSTLVERRNAIYKVLVSKSQHGADNILKILRNNIHPLLNHKILKNIFGCLDMKDVKNCRNVSQLWNSVAESMLEKRADIHFVSLRPRTWSDKLRDSLPIIPVTPLQLLDTKSDKTELQSLNLLLIYLFGKKLITEKEFHQAHKSFKLDIKRAEIFKLILYKVETDATSILEILLGLYVIDVNMNDGIKPVYTEGDWVYYSPAEIIRKKALSNFMVLKSIFSFLNLTDIKNARMVCRAWNAEVEKLLRKRTKIIFSSLTPSKFIEIFKYNLPALPFTAFNLKSKKSDNTWTTSEITEFFEKWGKRIKNFHLLGHISLKNEKKNTLESFNIRPWLNLSNLNELRIEGCGTKMIIPFIKLYPLKKLVLQNCDLYFQKLPDLPKKWKLQRRRMIPEDFRFCNVTFVNRDKKPLTDFCINDYIDFSKAKSITLNNILNVVGPIIDMSKEIKSAQIIKCNSELVINWAAAKATCDVLLMPGSHFTVKNHLIFKNICFGASIIDLAAQPATIERMLICNVAKFVPHMEPINLPNLQYLSLNVTLNDPNSISNFKNCEKLTDIYISLQETWYNLHIDINALPKSVKKLKLSCIEMVGEGEIHVDTLILDLYMTHEAENIISKVQPKNLVIYLSVDEIDYFVDYFDDVIRFVLDNTQLESIVISRPGLDQFEFKDKSLSKYIDKKADHYIFANQFGTAITADEFEILFQINEYETVEQLLVKVLYG